MVPDPSDVEDTPPKTRKRKTPHASKESSSARPSKRLKIGTAAPSRKRKADGLEDSDVPCKKQRMGGGGSFEIRRPKGCLPWVDRALEMLTSHDFGPQWRALIDAWLVYEKGYGFEDKRKPHLLASGRPQPVTDWINRGRPHHYRPSVGNLNKYESTFGAWWRRLQPDWRVEEGKDLLREVGGDWSCLQCSGSNGVLSVVAALFFWGYAIEGTLSSHTWNAAVGDVLYALQELVSNV